MPLTSEGPDKDIRAARVVRHQNVRHAREKAAKQSIFDQQIEPGMSVEIKRNEEGGAITFLTGLFLEHFRKKNGKKKGLIISAPGLPKPAEVNFRSVLDIKKVTK
jgi:hypothetical protein